MNEMTIGDEFVRCLLGVLDKGVYTEDISGELARLRKLAEGGGEDIESSESATAPNPPVSSSPMFATGVWKRSETLSQIGAKTFEHGLGGEPDIIVVISDYKTRYTSDYNPKSVTGYNAAVVVGGTFIRNVIREYHTVPATYVGTGQCGIASMAISGKNDNTAEGYISIPSVDGVASQTEFTINFSQNRRGGVGLTYRWYALKFDGSEFKAEG